MFLGMKKSLLTGFILSVLFFLTACNQFEDYEVDRLVDLDSQQAENVFGAAYIGENKLLVTAPFRHELRIYSTVTGELIETISDTPSFLFLYLDQDGKVLAGAPASFDPRFNSEDPTSPGSDQALANAGVWRIDPESKSLTQIFQLPPDAIPTHITSLNETTYLLSDIIQGQISSFNDNGLIGIWADDELLKGNPALPGPVGRPPMAVGIEGIQRRGNDLYGVVADYGRIVKIPVLEDGSAGEVTTVYEDAENLLGLAHFQIDAFGNFFAISGFLSKVWKIDFYGHQDEEDQVSVTLIADNQSEAQVDTPAQIVFGEDFKSLFFTNNALISNDDKLPSRPGISRLSVKYKEPVE